MGYLVLFYSNLIVSAMLFGLILVIHFVHYKSFHFIDTEKFVEFHNFHNDKYFIFSDSANDN